MRTAQFGPVLRLGQPTWQALEGVRGGGRGGDMERGLEKEEYRNGTPSPFSLSRFFRFPPASSHVGRDHYLGLIELIIMESAHSHHLSLALLVCLQLSRVVSRFLSAPH